MTESGLLLNRVIMLVNSAGSDNVGCFGGVYEGGYHIQQRPEEFSRLVCFLAAHGPFRAYLEIGTASGGTLRFLKECVQIERCVTIDDGRHPKFIFWTEQNRQCIENLSEFIGDSHSAAARQFLQELGIQFDLVGIDGDHSYEGVAADWRLVQPFLADGALVWFHDIRVCPGVASLWHELSATHSRVLETNQLGIGVLRVGRA